MDIKFTCFGPGCPNPPLTTFLKRDILLFNTLQKMRTETVYEYNLYQNRKP